MYDHRPRRLPEVLAVVALAALTVLVWSGRANATTALSSGTASAPVSEIATRWGWPLSQSAPTLLGFGSGYGSGSQARTHSGVDLAAQEGDSVRSPVVAIVSYVGQVPSGADRRVLTVTLETADGAKVSLMPLAGACIAVGERVSTGERVGALAADGDASSAATHLHVGIRHGSLYVDPSTYLVVPAPVAEKPPADARPTAEPSTVTHPASAPAPSQAVHAQAPAPGPAPVSVGAPAPQAAQVSAPQIRTTEAAHEPSPASGQAVASARTSAVTPAGAAPLARSAGVSAVEAAAPSVPALATSLPTLMRALRTRDSIVVNVVSYLVATLAAAGSLAAVVKRASRPVAEEPMIAPVSVSGD